MDFFWLNLECCRVARVSQPQLSFLVTIGVVSYRRRNHPCQILTRLVKGIGGYGSPKSGVSHWLWMSLLQQCYALTCYSVIIACIVLLRSRGTEGPDTWLHTVLLIHSACGEQYSFWRCVSGPWAVNTLNKGQKYSLRPACLSQTTKVIRCYPQCASCIYTSDYIKSSPHEIWSV